MNKQYAGAGVILLEYVNINNNYELCVIIVHNIYKNIYECPGGKIDNNDNTYKTASRELKEESLNLFNISKHYLTNKYSIDIKSGRRYYKAYVIHLIGPISMNKRIKLRFFFNNKKDIEKHNISSCWRETNNITKLSVNQFVNDINANKKDINSNLNTIDIYNRNIIFSRRDAELLKNAINHNLIVKNNYSYISNVPFYQLEYIKKYIPKNSNDYFLKNTKTYKIVNKN